MAMDKAYTTNNENEKRKHAIEIVQVIAAVSELTPIIIGIRFGQFHLQPFNSFCISFNFFGSPVYFLHLFFYLRT